MHQSNQYLSKADDHWLERAILFGRFQRLVWCRPFASSLVEGWTRKWSTEEDGGGSGSIGRFQTNAFRYTRTLVGFWSDANKEIAAFILQHVQYFWPAHPLLAFVCGRS